MKRHARVAWSRGMMVAALALPFTPAPPAAAQQPLVLVGMYVESNYSVQPGVQVGVSSPGLLGGAPRFTMAASSTRLATALGSNALVEDRFQLTAAWVFRGQARISPYVAGSGGYTRYDREDEELFALLDNGSPLAALLLGAETRLGRSLLLHGHLGYSGPPSSTVYPFVAAAGVNFQLRGGAR